MADDSPPSTNLGPLPTDFSLPRDCATKLTEIYQVFTSEPGWYYLCQGPVEQTICYPSAYKSATSQFYSPARCPTGFTSACGWTNAVGTVTETAVQCCPTLGEFTCQSENSYGWEETLGCTIEKDKATTTTWTLTQVAGGESTVTTSTGPIGGINAYSIQVRYQSTDFASSTTSTSSTINPTPNTFASKTTGSTTSTTPYPPAAQDHSDNESEGGLRGGVIAGIVVGVVVGLLMIVALIWWYMRNRKRQGEPGTAYNGGKHKDTSPQVAHEMDVPRFVAPEYAAELDVPRYVPEMSTYQPQQGWEYYNNQPAQK
ncbi:hypothetical protein GGS20DRAFT_164304 [Poronia punctata]|nr:hypothetical protein GGS20DRAFT_164304 [Poronia punctata]